MVSTTLISNTQDRLLLVYIQIYIYCTYSAFVDMWRHSDPGATDHKQLLTLALAETSNFLGSMGVFSLHLSPLYLFMEALGRDVILPPRYLSQHDNNLN